MRFFVFIKTKKGRVFYALIEVARSLPINMHAAVRRRTAAAATATTAAAVAATEQARSNYGLLLTYFSFQL